MCPASHSGPVGSWLSDLTCRILSRGCSVPGCQGWTWAGLGSRRKGKEQGKQKALRACGRLGKLELSGEESQFEVAKLTRGQAEGQLG